MLCTSKDANKYKLHINNRLFRFKANGKSIMIYYWYNTAPNFTEDTKSLSHIFEIYS